MQDGMTCLFEKILVFNKYFPFSKTRSWRHSVRPVLQLPKQAWLSPEAMHSEVVRLNKSISTGKYLPLKSL